MANDRKIPDKYRIAIYNMYSSGKIVSEIHEHAVNEWKLDVSERTIYNFIKAMRQEKLLAFRERLMNDTVDDMQGLEMIREKLEEFAGNCREDKRFFLKACEMLLDLYKFKLQFKQVNSSNNTFINDDNGKQKLIDELNKIN